jgi:hypothetical protein
MLGPATKVSLADASSRVLYKSEQLLPGTARSRCPQECSIQRCPRSAMRLNWCGGVLFASAVSVPGHPRGCSCGAQTLSRERSWTDRRAWLGCAARSRKRCCGGYGRFACETWFSVGCLPTRAARETHRWTAVSIPEPSLGTSLNAHTLKGGIAEDFYG